MRLRVCVCVHLLTSSPFCRIKTGQSSFFFFPLFFFFTQICTVMDTFSFVAKVGGVTALYFVLLPDRNISESTRRFQWVIPEDSVTFQQAERAPRAEARERPGRRIERERGERGGKKKTRQKPKEREMHSGQVFKKEETKEATRQRVRWARRHVLRGRERERGCESAQLSGNPRVRTVFQSKSIDLAGL